MYALLLLAASPPRVLVPDRPTIPVHDVALLDGCPDDQIAFTIGAIADTIATGAPLYNTGDHAACYRLYLGAATDIGHRLTHCPAVEQALLAGVNRAVALPRYTDGAWALRDAFDGLIYVFERKLANAHQPSGK